MSCEGCPNQGSCGKDQSSCQIENNPNNHIKKIVADLNELLVKHRLQNDVKVLVTYSLNDDDKISLIIYPEGTQYYDVEGYDKLEKIVSRHLAEGAIVKELLAKGEEKTDEQKESESEFINRQFRVVLKNSGIIDPERYVTDVLPLEKLQQALEMQVSPDAHVLKTVIRP